MGRDKKKEKKRISSWFISSFCGCGGGIKAKIFLWVLWLQTFHSLLQCCLLYVFMLLLNLLLPIQVKWVFFSLSFYETQLIIVDERLRRLWKERKSKLFLRFFPQKIFGYFLYSFCCDAINFFSYEFNKNRLKCLIIEINNRKSIWELEKCYNFFSPSLGKFNWIDGNHNWIQRNEKRLLDLIFL